MKVNRWRVPINNIPSSLHIPNRNSKMSSDSEALHIPDALYSACFGSFKNL
jgi:hypothetical protein